MNSTKVAIGLAFVSLLLSAFAIGTLVEMRNKYPALAEQTQKNSESIMSIATFINAQIEKSKSPETPPKK